MKTYKLNGEDVNEKGDKIVNTEEANYSKNRVKKLALVGLSALLLTVGAYGISRQLNQPAPTPQIEETSDSFGIVYFIDKSDCVDPIEYSFYSVPSGYTLTRRGNGMVGEKVTKEIVNLTATTKDGITTYSAPEGFEIVYSDDGYPIKAVRYTTEYVNATKNIVLKAPDGYILVGNKCYKLIDTEEKEKGR